MPSPKNEFCGRKKKAPPVVRAYLECLVFTSPLARVRVLLGLLLSISLRATIGIRNNAPAGYVRASFMGLVFTRPFVRLILAPAMRMGGYLSTLNTSHQRKESRHDRSKGTAHAFPLANKPQAMPYYVLGRHGGWLNPDNRLRLVLLAGLDRLWS